MIYVISVVVMWWLCGVIATLLLYKRGKVIGSDLTLLLPLSIFPGPFAFCSLLD